MRSRYGLLIASALLGVAVIGTALVLIRPAAGCPAEWSKATRVELGASFADVVLDGKPFRVGGNALLDYMPHPATSPFDATRPVRHPLGVTASISAPSREALGEPVFTCVRAIRGSETWAGRPMTYGTQTMADGYPPGATPPANNEAWRQAARLDGPEWPDGDQISLELWVSVHGRPYVFVVPPFALQRGG